VVNGHIAVADAGRSSYQEVERRYVSVDYRSSTRTSNITGNRFSLHDEEDAGAHVRHQDEVERDEEELQDDVLHRVLLDAVCHQRSEELDHSLADVLEVSVLDEHEQSDDAQGDAEEVERKQDEMSLWLVTSIRSES